MLLMTFVAPPLLIYHIVLLALWWRRCIREANPHYMLSLASTKALLAYYLASLFVQFFMDDGGDQGNMGSAAQQRWGVPKHVNNFMELASLVTAVLLMVVLMWLVCKEETPSSPHAHELLPTNEEF